MDVKRSRRNSRDSLPPAHLVTLVNSIGDRMEPKFKFQGNHLFCRMIGGVHLNGRLYKQSDMCEYLPRVPRSNIVRGSSDSFRVGFINMFYTFEDTSLRLPKLDVFVSVTDVPVRGRERSLYLVDNIHGQRGVKEKFNFVHDSSRHTLLHIDAITAKVLVVPHFNPDPEIRSRLMVAIPMWYAR